MVGCVFGGGVVVYGVRVRVREVKLKGLQDTSQNSTEAFMHSLVHAADYLLFCLAAAAWC
jgi:hypothetical protein